MLATLCDKISSPAPVAQWTECRPPEPKSAVRVCAGALFAPWTNRSSNNGLSPDRSLPHSNTFSSPGGIRPISTGFWGPSPSSAWSYGFGGLHSRSLTMKPIPLFIMRPGTSSISWPITALPTTTSSIPSWSAFSMRYSGDSPGSSEARLCWPASCASRLPTFSAAGSSTPGSPWQALR